MRMCLRRPKGWTPIVVILLCLSFVGVASAQERNRRGVVGKSDPSVAMRWVPVESVNVSKQRVKIGGRVYAVTETSKLLDADGNRLRLQDLRGFEENGFGDMVEIETRRSGREGQGEIRSLKVVDVGSP
jgi:hypothetical protein